MTLNQNYLNRLLKVLPGGLFFLFAFIFYWFFAPHIFYYQEKSSLFVFSMDFLKENLQQPGGLLVYLSTFLTAIGYYPVAGSLIASFILLMILVLSSVIIRRTSIKSARLLLFLIVLALFYMQGNYQYTLVNNLGLLLQLALFCMALKKPGGWLIVVLAPVWYYTTGGFALVFFVLYTILQITARPGKYIFRTSIFWLIIIISFFVSKEFLFFQSIGDLLTFPWSQEGTGSQVKVFTGVVIVICLLPLLAEIKIRNPLSVSGNISRLFYYLAGSFLLIVIMTLIAIKRYDKKTFDYFKVEKLFVENEYQKVIDFNLRNPSNNKLTAYLNNIALCETGRLNDLLFHFPQNPDGSTLFLKWEIVSEILRRGGYFYYCTGMINEAHRWAFEYMVMKGPTPEGVKMIIKTELINSNYKTASRYVDILGKTLFYRDDANEFKKLLFNDNAVDVHAELGQKRTIRVHRDFFSITDDPFINIERVIATDSLNRQAFEYKLAWLLLSKDYQGIANEWVKLDRYNFRSIPVHAEEAAVAIIRLYNIDLPSSGNLRISSNTEQRFTQFLRVFQAYGSNLQSAEPELKKQFGNTFWYYVFYK